MPGTGIAGYIARWQPSSVSPQAAESAGAVVPQAASAEINGYLALAAAQPRLPRLDTSRLRATWLADCAQLLGLATFMHAAGITCSQRLGDLLATQLRLHAGDPEHREARCAASSSTAVLLTRGSPSMTSAPPRPPAASLMSSSRRAVPGPRPSSMPSNLGPGVCSP